MDVLVTVRSSLTVLVLVLASASPARAQTPGSVGKFLAGAAIAFGVHEAGHVATAAVFSADPGLKRIDYGGIPFFAIDHRPVTRRQEFTISSAGFWGQHVGSEWILTGHPNVRDEEAPLLKGVLAFNMTASVVYGVAAFAEIGPDERDTRGVAVSLGRDGVSERAVGVLVIAPAVLDGYRYFRPNARWAAWASRGAKILSVVLVVAAGRE